MNPQNPYEDIKIPPKKRKFTKLFSTYFLDEKLEHDHKIKIMAK